MTNELERIKSQGADGNLSFESFSFSEMRTVLLTSMSFDASIPEAERNRIISDAIFAVGKMGPITTKELLGSIRRQENTYLRKSPSIFHVRTSLLLTSPFIAHTSQVDGIAVKLAPTIPQVVRFQLDSDHPGAPQEHRDLVRRYQPVLLRVKARGPFEAIERGTDALDFLRGLWNWRLNRPLISRSGNEREAVNQVRLGPSFTIHNSDGALAFDTYWFDPEWSAPRSIPSVHSHWNGLFKEEMKVRAILRSIPYAADLQVAFVRYVRALDSSNPELRMLRLWNVLEFLTGTVKADYDTLIRRAAFVWEDHHYAKLVLGHIRIQRNSHIHGAGGSDNCDQYALQLKRYVEAVIRVHLGIGREFASLTEACRLFDLPKNRVTLREGIVLRRLGLKFLRA